MPRWALGLLGAVITALAVVLVWLFYLADPDRRIAGNPATFGETTLRDPGVLLREPAASSLLGRPVVLEEVEVIRVVGDVLFWVRAGSGEIPVVLFGELTSRQPEQAKVIRAGDRLRIYGQVRLVRDLAGFGADLSSTERRAVLDRRTYLSALRVVVLEG